MSLAKKIGALFAALAFIPALALAQTSPGFVSGAPLTAAQLNAFGQGKLDYNAGALSSVSLKLNGCTLGANALCATGNASISGSLGLGGATIGANALAVVGATSLSGAVTLNGFNLGGVGTLSVGGATIGSNALAVTGTTDLGGTLVMSGGNVRINFGALQFGASTDLILSRKAAANLRLGDADAAAPVAQTLGVQGVVAGTANTAGANFTIAGSQGTGTAAGGSILFQVSPPGSAGSAQNALVTAMTIDANKNWSNAFGVTLGASLSGITSVLANSDVRAGSSGKLYWAASTILTAPADGQEKCTNAAATAVCSIIGTATNDNAAAGAIGEYICAKVTNGGSPSGCATNSATPVAFASTATVTVTSISLTAGDWEVCGNVFLNPVGAGFTSITAGISNVAATQPSNADLDGALNIVNATFSGSGQVLPTGCKRFSTASTASQYLVASGNTTGSGTAWGIIWARRTR